MSDYKTKRIAELEATVARLQAEVEQLTDDRNYWVQSSSNWRNRNSENVETIDDLRSRLESQQLSRQ
jgi:hypothetical protein